ncbi:ATP-binding protein [Halorussus sp. AFM4]|uniref:ATP-binding protein n=1 Tax=Halorussus sp. AFM4 TaxID=3421651 RepID=UPI003EBB1174
MASLSQFFSEDHAGWVLAVLGGSFVLLTALHIAVAHTDQPLAETLIDTILIAGPGFGLLYTGYRLPRTEIHETVYPSVVKWSLGGLGVMLGVVGLLILNPGGSVDRPVRALLIATALGSVGGLGIGLHDARAQTRAVEAEQYSYALEQANARIERQHQRLESFAGMLAHELRNPLQIAQIYHQQEQPQNEQAAEEVATAHDRIEEMIDILLITVRGKSATTAVEPVAIADQATDAWAAVTTDTVDGELVVETEETVQADAAHLQYLFRQLFRNSLEHGGSDVTVRVASLPDQEGFYIEDDGPGIPEDVREDVLKVGFTTKADGQGLGLTFAAQLAEAYDWTWTITESATDGARFEFRDVDQVAPEQEDEEEVHRN